MPVFTDQTGRIVSLTGTPRRIISLVPSQTELLADLGLNEEVVGITKFCVHPQTWFKTRTRVGGTKQLKIDLIKSLHPDLIIANKEENVREQVEELEKHFPVWVSDVNDLDSAYEMIGQIGKITDRGINANEIIRRIKETFSGLPTIASRNAIGKPMAADGLRTVYLIWKDPYMTVGGDTFIHSMLEKAGFENIFSHRTRYPEINLQELPIANCQLVLLSSEPYPFQQKHIDGIRKELPLVKIMLVDGEMFSWYGSRLQYAASYFTELKTRLQMITDI